MNVVKATIGQIVVLSVVGAVIALAVNTTRAKGSLDPWKNYFDTGGQKVRELRTKRQEDLATSSAADPAASDSTAATPSAAAPETDAVKHLEHDYQPIAHAEVVEVFMDPNTEMGANLIIDARNDDLYEEGHIPGAFQVDAYQMERYIDDVMVLAEGADKVIAYCNGGDCEDSMFVCRDLLEAGVLYEKLYLYEGGWTEWVAKGMPVETGRREEGGE